MNNRIARSFLFPLLASAPALAGTIDVTSASRVTVPTNDSLLFFISSTFRSSGDAVVYPGEIQMLLAGLPVSGLPAPIPGTSAVYLPGFLFAATLQSLDGSIIVPLSDPNARRLDLPAGDLLLTPGAVTASQYSGPIDLLSASVTPDSQNDAALFGPGEIVIDLRNLGAPFTFGYPSSPIAASFSASLFTPDGLQSTGARLYQLDLLQAPEPGPASLLLIGLTLLVTSRAIRMRSRSEPRPREAVLSHTPP